MIPTIGLHRSIPLDDYLAWEAWSPSTLKLGYLDDGSWSSAHLRHAIDNPRPATDSQRLGSVLHALILEPERLLDGFVVMPDFAAQVRTKDGRVPASPRATGEYKALVASFAEANPGKTILDPNQHERMRGMALAIRGHAAAMDALISAGESEESLVFHDVGTDLLCKRRSDKPWIEVKTTSNIGRFDADVIRFGYDLQLAMEHDARLILFGQSRAPAVIAVQSEPPFVVRFAPISRPLLDHGRDRYRRALVAVKECLQSGVWPGPPDPECWELPAWASGKMTPTFGGSEEGIAWD